MPKHRLTEIYIRNLEPPPRYHRMIWDTLQSSFGIQITPRGVKSFKVVYHHEGRLRWYHIDRFPTIGLSDARKVARQIRAKVALGEDPQGKKINDRRAAKLAKVAEANDKTLKQVAEQYVERYAQHENKSWRQSENLMKRYVFPTLGARKITEIIRKDVRRLFGHITVDKKKPALANQVLAAISAVLQWAVEQEIVENNQARGIKRNKSKNKEEAKRYLDDDELKLVWSKFEDLGFYPTMALRFILVTAQRPGEVCAMRWQDVDLQKKIWTLPGKPTGDWPGTKNAHTHKVPLSPQAVAILEEIGLK